MLGKVTAALFFILLIWGNLVAGMQAGMACPDWPLCHGKFLPPIRVDIWMEFMHRVIAAVAGVSLLFLARRRLAAYKGLEKAIPVAAVALLAIEIALGGVVVLLDLPVQLTTIHFMVGLAIFLLVLYMASCDGERRPARVSFAGYAGALFCVMILLFSQASLGAYLRHSAAGLACPDFPTCQGQWIPTYWDAPTATNYTHRLLALGVFFTALLLYVASIVDQRIKRLHNELLALVCLVLLQIGVGAAVVKTGLGYAVTSLHLALTLGIVGVALRAWLMHIRENSGVAR